MDNRRGPVAASLALLLLLTDQIAATEGAAIDNAPNLQFAAESVRSGTRFRRGDANEDDQLDISDPVSVLGSIFLGTVEISCEDAADANDDGAVDVSDAVFTLSFLFLNGPPPPPPGPEAAGSDPTPDEFSCGDPSIAFSDIPDLTLGSEMTTRDPSPQTVVDLDGDGQLDLVSAIFDGIAIFYQEELREFPGTPDLIPLNSDTADAPVSVAAADLDDDGLLDLVSANAVSNNLTVFFQRETRQFADEPDRILGNSFFTNLPTTVVAVDLDGDGLLDLVSSNLGSDNLTAFFQEDSGEFETFIVLGDSTTTFFPRTVSVVDLDGDGALDLASPTSDNLAIFFQRGPRKFSAIPDVALENLPTTSLPVSLATEDLNGDNLPDFVTANRFSDNLTVFFQKEPREFTNVPDLTLGSAMSTESPNSVVVADLDGNGRLDLISANEASDSLAVFLQRDPGVFPDVPDLELGSSETTDRPVEVLAADLDGDGLLDIISGNAGTDNLAVFFGGGPLE